MNRDKELYFLLDQILTIKENINDLGMEYLQEAVDNFEMYLAKNGIRKNHIDYVSFRVGDIFVYDWLLPKMRIEYANRYEK